MSAATLRPPPRRNRAVRTILWLAALALLWAGAIGLARRTGRPGVFFMLAIVLTYFGSWGWALAVSRDRRRTVFRGLRASLTVLVILVCLEVPAALKLVDWGAVFGRLAGEPDYLDRAFVDDPDTGFRRRPNDHWSGRPATGNEEWDVPPPRVEPLDFTTDGRGYRNPGDLGRADVVLLGDSYVEGYGVSDEQTAARALRRRLGRAVANLGVAGYGPMQELIVLRRDALRLRPAVAVWFFFEGNDLYDDERFESLMMAPASRQSWSRRSFTVNSLRRLRPWVQAILPNRPRWPYFGYLSLPGKSEEKVYILDKTAMIPWRDYEAGRWERTRKALREGADLCRAEGVHLLLCYVPTQFRVYRPLLDFPPDSPCRGWEVWPLPELFADFCRSADVPCLDLTGLLRDEIRRGGNPYLPGDIHWGPEGHALVADRLAKEVRQRNWLPAPKAGR